MIRVRQESSGVICFAFPFLRCPPFTSKAINPFAPHTLVRKVSVDNNFFAGHACSVSSERKLFYSTVLVCHSVLTRTERRGSVVHHGANLLSIDFLFSYVLWTGRIWTGFVAIGVLLPFSEKKTCGKGFLGLTCDPFASKTLHVKKSNETFKKHGEENKDGKR